MSKTLLRQLHPLAAAVNQRAVLERPDPALPGFAAHLAAHRLPPLHACGIDCLQINLGKLCNQTCRHCHVDAGPDRREIMSAETADACLRVLAETGIGTVDLTGGAPEMNPEFRRIVTTARGLNRHVIDRCNLTILLAKGYEDLPEFLAAHQVGIVASLPCYLPENTDSQRGDGVFDRSVTALRRLNALGYGEHDGLPLTLVYNPLGATLPPDQSRLEADYREQLLARYGVRFTRLYTITNMPISRFLDDLLQRGEYERYLQRLVDAFNPAAVYGVMCRTLLSVDWQGNLYDCDFNQMLELPLRPGLPRNIRDFNAAALAGREISVGRHCFGCTAGAGSGCQGAVTVQ